ncbi:MAG TPA: STAS domain-containing protein [Chondromyces sp.]|nr:STAS domain-containing protein [Chondromyces sp.]
MEKNNELYEFLLEKTWQLSEEWYQSLEKSDPSGVYASDDPEVVHAVKQQNHEFYKRFCKLFIEDEEKFYKDFEAWVIAVAKDEEHLNTPLHFILREFFRAQDQYFNLIKEFDHLHKGKYSIEEMNSWNQLIAEAFGKIITWFTREHHKYAQTKLKAQQEMINELSSPVISLHKDIALLPLVGDIDTVRAKFIFESTLEQCAKKRVGNLLIDLSGVVMIDTMVAHQIFQLIEALSLIGVKSTLSGIRPEVAQTAVQLGLNFKDILIISDLEQAVNLLIKIEN